MAAACPRADDPDAPARAELALLMLEGARRLLRERPPPWPEPDPTEDPDEPAIVRKQRRRRRGGHQ